LLLNVLDFQRAFVHFLEAVFELVALLGEVELLLESLRYDRRSKAESSVSDCM